MFDTAPICNKTMFIKYLMNRKSKKIILVSLKISSRVICEKCKFKYQNRNSKKKLMKESRKRTRVTKVQTVSYRVISTNLMNIKHFLLNMTYSKRNVLRPVISQAIYNLNLKILLVNHFAMTTGISIK